MPDIKIDQAYSDAHFMMYACYEARRSCEQQRETMAAQRETMARIHERQTMWKDKQARKDEELYEPLR